MQPRSEKTRGKIESAIQHGPTRRGFTLVEILILAAVIGLLFATAAPWFINSRAESHTQTCLEAQAKLDEAIQDWAVETNQQSAAIPAWNDLVGTGLFLSQKPVCPEASASLALHPVNGIATCPGHIAAHARI